MRLLCVGDIHGQLGALRAVLATAEKRSFHKLLVAGDLLFPGPDALETWRRLSAANAVMVQGATDRALATLRAPDIAAKGAHEQAMVTRMADVQKELGDLILTKLRRLPLQERIPLEDGRELVLVHGSPVDSFEAMSFDMSDEELLALVGDDPADVVVCGMSHVPFDRTIADVRIINVGSVGDAPDGRTSADKPLVAHATWIESTPTELHVESISVPLD
jgi:predicted phosphodiesterase